MRPVKTTKEERLAPDTGPERPAVEEPDRATSLALRSGWAMLAVFLPMGLVLEALHALKVPVYFRSDLRRELWTLAHAHGNLLGLLCLAFAALGVRTLANDKTRERVAKLLVIGAWLMPLGFFAGGVLNSEGDPSFGIAAVPVGGVLLLAALLRAAIK
jgi:hypothetical protein